jgi:hypothetical protein
MTEGRVMRAVRLAFASDDEISISKLRAALFREYSEAELLRAGCGCGGQIPKSASEYISGNSISNEKRAALIEAGLKRILRTRVKHEHKKLLVFDETKGTVRRVRP